MNSKNRQDNKSNGPWGMHEFDFTYRKVGDSLEKIFSVKFEFLFK